MCRLFGFRSRVNVGVHHSLVLAENALALQSHDNPDGWGIGFYEGQRPLLRRGVAKAIGDEDFSRLARFVRSHAVVAHVRLGTVGENKLENTHPFQAGRWTFAHNGTVRQMELFHDRLMEAIAPKFRPLIIGDTDSERCFYLFLSELEAIGGAVDSVASGRVAIDALGATVRRLIGLADAAGAEPPVLNFVVTDGRSLAACRLGRGLYFSTQKRYCEKMDECSRWRSEADLPCLHPLRADTVNHLLVSSERISASDIWETAEEGELLGLDASFGFVRDRVVATSASELDARYAPFYEESGQCLRHQSMRFSG